jgi:TonB family protein
VRFVQTIFVICLLSFSTQLTPDQPQPIHVESLTYPDFARAAQIHETIVVEIIVNREGDVRSAIALSGHPELRNASVANIQLWKFRPSSTENRHLSVQYVFRLDEPKRYYKPETRNIYDLPTRVEVISNLPESQP